MTVEEIYKSSQEHPIIFYDGVCNLCNGFVNMVIRNDREGKIKYCALQDSGGLKIRSELGLSDNISTSIALYKGKIYTHSEVLKIVAKKLGGKWRMLLPLFLLPKKLRDHIYNWVANNRYNWFGKSDNCMVPDPSNLSRFIC